MCSVAGEPSFHWNRESGDQVLCGMCKDQSNQQKMGKCAVKTGNCQYGCIDGWEGATKGDASAISSGKGSMCDQPICKEDHCGPYGYCVRPNECVCAKLTSKDNVTGGCYQLRVWGLCGAAAALVVMTLAISLCHIIQTIHTRKTN